MLLNGALIPAHRASYLIFLGDIPSGKDLHHICENPSCVNPDHLLPVTPKEHVRLTPKHNALKTHCKRGHEFTPENTILPKRSGRLCRECTNATHREGHTRRLASDPEKYKTKSKETYQRYRDKDPERTKAKNARSNARRRQGYDHESPISVERT